MITKHGLYQAKTRGILAGFAVLLLAAIFSLTGCSDDDDGGGGGSVPAEFVGTWTGTSGTDPDITSVSIVIKADGAFTATFGGGYTDTDTGTCTASGSTITFTTDHNVGSGTLANNKLTIQWNAMSSTVELTK
jgi:hypothetical protein